MEAFHPDARKAALLGLLAVASALSLLARWHPDVRWLQLFRWRQIQLTEGQRERWHLSANRLAALELIAAGLVLPLLHSASTVMMFNDFKTAPTVIVAACSLPCIVLGIWILARSFHRKEPRPRP